MGAYGVATRELQDLQRHLGEEGSKAAGVLDDSDLRQTAESNRDLRDGSDPAGDRRHPDPPRQYSPPTEGPRLRSIVVARLANPIAEFYETTIAAIEQTLGHDSYADQAYEQPEPIAADSETRLIELGKRLEVTQDPQRRMVDPDTGRATKANAERARASKLERMKLRAHKVGESLQPHTSGLLDPKACVSRILEDCLAKSAGQGNSVSPRDTLQDLHLHQVVIAALIDGHLRMHHAEHELSTPFGQTLADRGQSAHDIQAQLDASISLHTFAYVAARSMPWIFAEDEGERDSVIAYYQESCDNLTPPYCMWIAKQVSLLALHRRGFSYWLQDEVELAYKDFYKLRRQIRQTSRSLRSNVVFPPGAHEFLDGLYAIAEHHTGRIYQSEHAHDVALRHFKQATTRLQRLEPAPSDTPGRQAAARALLHNSRWRVRLLIGQGKANYELGKVKASLLCNVEAWKCFLQLLESERRADANLEAVDEVIDWLRLVVDDPDLDKQELKERFIPLVAQFRTITRSIHLRSLAADIIARIAHTLLVLKLPRDQAPKDRNSEDRTPKEQAPKETDDRLAYRALSNAAELDKRSTSVSVDLLNIKHRSPDDYAAHGDLPRAAPKAVPIGDQWPGGGSEFETAARAIEYVLQMWITGDSEEPPSNVEPPIGKRIADRLLPAFTTHTDSSNVKLAQVYRYLMQGPRPIRDGAARLEFVCARRYSSFFPFLPRPSAFRVRGGGYFARIIDDDLPERAKGRISKWEEKNTFGIAIDPGPNFLDNLYRCGYGLADIDMVIVTHDHADHVAELDAMLALLSYRSRLGEDRFRPLPNGWTSEDDEGKANALLLPIVGNESIRERYAFYDGIDPNAVTVLGFNDLERLTTPGGEVRDRERYLLLPPSIRFEAVDTNHRDAQGKLAQGFTLAVVDEQGESASIGFTSDTGDIGQWPGTADVVVAHVSTVPLPDLRKLAELHDVPAHAAEETERFQRLWESAGGREQIGRARHDPPDFLLRQLQFGFWSPADRQQLGPDESDLSISPLSALSRIRQKDKPEHLYLKGLVDLAERLQEREKGGLLVVGELREELGSFRSRIASELNDILFRPEGRINPKAAALTADIGLAVEIEPGGEIKVLCSTCDLDNDMTHGEQFHEPLNVYEVCVKGEHEGVFYNCRHHNPQSQSKPTFVELVERYDVFGY